MNAFSPSSMIQYDRSGLFIHDQPVIALCSSLFYFRIPRARWRERLQAVRALGYNCIDVYFPWNYHESQPDVWDFSGERDVAAFLQLAAEEGLWVIARPGPYICSEWDGGALPAYLLTEPEIRLRDNDPLFLRHVARWYAQIMPLMQQYQLGNQGTIIALQLDNELDFYACGDPSGYIAALRDLALGYDLQIPLIACAGQGDLWRAGGEVAGVLPTCNFYPDDRDLNIEALVSRYVGELAQRNLPLCVTETNRKHSTLRRLLSCGAKLLGPYLQTSGTNYGFYNAINNWGDPLALMASDYDFGGMIDAFGQQRAEAGEARLLSQQLRAFGAALALAEPIRADLMLETTLPLPEDGLRALALHGGGMLLALPNPGEHAASARIHTAQSSFPAYTSFQLEAEHCPLLPLDLPLNAWGIDGTLRYSTAEISFIHHDPQRPQLILNAVETAEIALTLPGSVTIHGQGQHFITPDQIVLVLAVGDSAEIMLESGQRLLLRLISRTQASRLGDWSELDAPAASEEAAAPNTPLDNTITWRNSLLNSGGLDLASVRQDLGGQPQPLEALGILRGFGWYGAKIPSTAQQPIQGFLLQDAADILSLYVSGVYQGSAVPGGSSVYLPAQAVAPDGELLVRAEIWGHSNFNDASLPALRLRSLKGLSGVIAVTHSTPLNSNWRWLDANRPDAAAHFAPSAGWGNWMSSDSPEQGDYVKSIQLAPDTNAWVLHFSNLQALVRVMVNGQNCGLVNPLAPFVDLTPYLQAGARVEIRLTIERWHRESAGQITLFQGQKASDWWAAGADEQVLWQAANRNIGQLQSLPLTLEAGEVAWLIGDVDGLAGSGRDWAASCVGQNAKITVFFQGHVVGRVWLQNTSVQPVVKGGDPNLITLAAPWFQPSGNQLALLVEAIEVGQPAHVAAIQFQPR